jgi:hypothetical protein
MGHYGVLRSAHTYVQSLLVQAVWRSKDPRTADLRRWAQGIGHRRGKNMAVVALARRLARILYAMWRNGESRPVECATPPSARIVRRHYCRATQSAHKV